MKKTIFFSGLMILLVVVLTAAVTWAYFSNTENQTTTITTALIDLDATAGFPLTFSLLLPGETQYQDVAVKNIGNRDADFYVQLLSDGSGTDFCNPSPVLNVCQPSYLGIFSWHKRKILRFYYWQLGLYALSYACQ